jgi:Condensation domain
VTALRVTSAILRLRFSTGQDAVAPLTWAQRTMWGPMKWFGKEANQFNLARALVLPRPVAQDRVLAVLRSLIEGHETFRTRFVDSGSGPRQQVSASGDYEISVADDRANPKEAGEDVAATLRRDAFDLEGEWPLRVCCVVDGERRVTAIALVGSHLAFDIWAFYRLADLVLHQLTDEDGRTTEAVGTSAHAAPQPLEQAAYQASAAGELLNQRGLRHWERRLSAAPASMFDLPRTETGDLPIERYLLDSTAVTAAAAALAQRTGTSVSSVLLCLTALALTAYNAHDRCAMKLIAGNRLSRRERDLIALSSLDACLNATIDDTDLLTAIKRVHGLAMVAYSRAQCDPLAVNELIKEIGRRRGVSLDLSAYYNSVQTGSDWQSTMADVSPAQLAELRRDSRFAPLAPLSKSDMKFFLTAADRGGGVSRLHLLVDTAYLPAPLGETILRGIETLLCDAVAGEVGTREVASRMGITPVHRGPEWVRTAAGWVNLEAVGQLVSHAAAGAKVAVFVQADRESDGAHKVTAYVAGLPISPRALHETVLDLLPGRTGVAAPAEYVICSTPPGGSSRTAWAAAGGTVYSRESLRDGC